MSRYIQRNAIADFQSALQLQPGDAIAAELVALRAKASASLVREKHMATTMLSGDHRNDRGGDHKPRLLEYRDRKDEDESYHIIEQEYLLVYILLH